MNRGIIIVAAALAPTFASADESPSAGQIEFYTRCAVCHGIDARGNGPMAETLKVKVPDLTQLSIENGRTFPYERVIRVIDGREMVAAHGTRDMPVWGDAFVDEAFGDSKGFMGSLRSEIYIAGRIHLLIRYIESVQVE